MQVSSFDTSRCLSAAILFTVLTAFSAGAPAQQLLTTTDTGTQGAGGNLLEVAYSRDRARAGRGEEKESEWGRSLEATYTYGLTETLDIYAGVSHARLRSKESGFDENGDFTITKGRSSGFGNTTIGAKWRFFDNEESGTSLAINPEIVLPVSSQREEDGLGTGRTSGSLTFVLSQTLPFGSLNFNAGIGRDRNRNREDNPNATIRSFSVAPVWEISERWKVAFDTGVNLTRLGDGSREREKFSEITAVYTLAEGVEVSIAYTRATVTQTHAADGEVRDPRSKNRAMAIGVAWAF